MGVISDLLDELGDILCGEPEQPATEAVSLQLASVYPYVHGPPPDSQERREVIRREHRFQLW
jgi:hypothetical protein